MADALTVTLRLTADASGYSGVVKVAKDDLDKLGQAAKTAGDASKVATESSTAQMAKAVAIGQELGKLIGDTAKKVVEWGEAVISNAAALKNWADQTGSNIATLSELANVAKVSGVSQDALRIATERLSVSLARQDEEGQRASRALAALGITTKDPAEAIKQLATQLDQYADGANKAALVQDILGRGAQRLLPFLKDLADAHHVGATTTTVQAEAADHLEKQWRTLEVQGGGLKDVILSDIVPALTSVIERMNIARELGGSWWRALDLSTVIKPMQSVDDALGEVNKQIADAKAKLDAGVGVDGIFNFVTPDSLDRLKLARDYLLDIKRAELDRKFGVSNADPRDLALQQHKPQAPAPPPNPGSTTGISLNSIFGDYRAQADTARNAANLFAQIQKDGLDRQLADLNFAHQAQLVSERDYIAQRAALQQQAAQVEVDKASAEYAALQAELAKVASSHPANDKEALAQKKEIERITRDIQSAEVARQLAENKANDASVKGSQAAILYDKQLAQIKLQITRDAEDYSRGLSNQVDDMKLQLELIGQTATAQQQATAVRALERQEAEKLLAIDRQIADLADKPGSWSQILALMAARKQVVDDTQKAVDATGNLIAKTNDATGRTSALSDAWHAVDDTAWAFVQKLQSGWKGAMDYMRDTLKNTLLRALYEMTVQKYIVNVFANVSGAGPGTFAGSAPTTAALGAAFGGSGNSNPMLSSGLSGMGSVGTALGGVGGLAGGAFGAALGAGGSAGMATLGIAMQAGAGAVGGMGAVLGAGLATLGAAIPYIGIALAIYSLVAGNKDPSKVKGQFGVSAGTSGFEDNAYTASKFGNLGFVDSGTQQFSGSAAQVFNQQIQGTLDAIATRLSPEQIARVATQLQGTQFAGKEGTFTTEDFIKQYGADVLKQVITTAFDELDPVMAKLVSQFQGTADEITGFANSLLTLHDALSGDPMKNATDAWAAANQTAYEVFSKQGQLVVDLSSKYDGSAAATAQLAQETGTYRAQLLQMILATKQAQAAIHAMFSDTRESIQTAGLDNKALYSFYQQRADDLFAQVGNTKDPALIQQYASKINDYFSQAFSLLSPEDQLANKPAFLQHLDELDTAIGARLDTLASTFSDDSKAPFAAVTDALAKSADKIAAAADTGVTTAAANQGAANTTQSAANTMLDAAKSLGQALSNIHVTATVDPSAVGG